MSIPTMIQQALDFEEKGATFYQAKAGEAANPLVKRLFLALAIEENQHQLRIQEIYHALQSDGPWPEATGASTLQEVIRSLFSNLSAAERKVSDNVEALVMAMEMERKGYAMYQEAMQGSEGVEQRFFRSMMAEEGAHLEALENVYYFLTDTEDWFASEESKVWNWMTS